MSRLLLSENSDTSRFLFINIVGKDYQRLKRYH